ncbi:Mobile element protein [Candidatus Accumulibacter phosphatis]|uniref:Mobile element protein n=1 Tax=Candidatus Accumulibacter phosphatis TaxID=327160 RepID=A0A5S4EGX9_9PROT|nr:Mobile element protein [Candidatus Accumulibacter phosphatis]
MPERGLGPTCLPDRERLSSYLHSNNSVLVILDEMDRTVLQRRLPNNLEQICQALCAHREAIEGIAVESTYHWYWLVDGLMEAGYRVHLVNTAAVKQYEGLKHKRFRIKGMPFKNLLIFCPDDHDDASNMAFDSINEIRSADLLYFGQCRRAEYR